MNKSDLNQTTALTKIRTLQLTTPGHWRADIGAETIYDTYVSELPADALSRFVAATFSPQLRASELADPSPLFLISEIGTETAGYAMLQEASPLTLTNAHALKIPRIYLRQAWIGRGVGSAP